MIGRRSAFVFTDPMHDELAPSGTLSQEAMHEGEIDCRLQVLLELEEETGIKKDDVSSIVPLGAYHTSAVPALDICVDINVNHSIGPILPPLNSRPPNSFGAPKKQPDSKPSKTPITGFPFQDTCCREISGRKRTPLWFI